MTTPNLALPELAADEIADFGAPQASLSIAVCQLSATIGRGIAAAAVLAVP
jgi:hypothetical protein